MFFYTTFVNYFEEEANSKEEANFIFEKKTTDHIELQVVIGGDLFEVDQSLSEIRLSDCVRK